MEALPVPQFGWGYAHQSKNPDPISTKKTNLKKLTPYVYLRPDIELHVQWGDSGQCKLKHSVQIKNKCEKVYLASSSWNSTREGTAKMSRKI